MNPAWSRVAGKVVNSPLMRKQPITDQADFVEAAAKVESADELPDRWREFVIKALA